MSDDVWVDAQGHRWTLAEWERHARLHGIAWHVRLDGGAILAGPPWHGGDVLLEPVHHRPGWWWLRRSTNEGDHSGR